MTRQHRPTADSPDRATRALLHSTDWSRTPLGPLATWPRALRGYAEMVLDMPAPAIIFWGAHQTQIYNDGYAAIMGPRHPRHPRYFGAPYRESRPDTYPLIHPWMQHVLDGGTWKVEREHVPVTRHGFDEEACFTFTSSALRDDDGRIAGILQPVFDVTESVLADRRAETLQLFVPERQVSSTPLDDALAAMAGNAADIPFARVWLWNAEKVRLAVAGEVGVSMSGDGEDAAALDGAALAAWTDNESRFVERLPGVAAGLVRGVLVLPLEGSDGTASNGVVAFGVSRRLPAAARRTRNDEDASHEVMTESDPVIALERARATQPDVCLLDIGLPRMDGHEFARRLRASDGMRAATLVALTGYGQAADREKAMQAGFDHFMVKPLNPEALARLLRSVVRRRRIRSAQRGADAAAGRASSGQPGSTPGLRSS